MLAPLIPARLCSTTTMHSDAAAPALFAALTPPCRGIYGDKNIDCELAAMPRLCSAQNDIRMAIQFNDVYTHTHTRVYTRPENVRLTYGQGGVWQDTGFAAKKERKLCLKCNTGNISLKYL